MANESFSSLLKEGQKVDLFMTSEEQPYVVTVESVDNNSLKITAPLTKGYYLPVEIGTPVELRVGNSNGMYRIPLRIANRENGHIPALSLQPNGEIDRIQRRTLLRMDIFVDFELEFPYGSVYKPPVGFKVYSGRRGNLSGGGLYFFSSKPLAVDFKANVRMNLEPHFSRPVHAQTRVVRVDDVFGSTDIFGIALEFTSIREGDRDKIIAYVLHKERDIIRRSLGE
jgi:c-di-GMP-binding flagellar brake protein YcgR